jgi:ubiquitin-protein ligase
MIPDPSSLFDWNAEIKGPKGSPYEGGLFRLKIDVPLKYPYAISLLASLYLADVRLQYSDEPPSIVFETP